MNDKCTLTMLDIETGQIKEFIGYWSWKEIYSEVKKYEKTEKWKVIKIEKQI